MPLSGTSRVEKLKARRDVNGLIRMLRFQDNWDVCESAAKALGELKDARAVAPLVTTLQHSYYRVRDAAEEALRAIGSPAVEALGAALKDPDEMVRTAAAGLLWEIGDVRAMEALIAALQDPCCQVRRYAAGALRRIGDARALVAFAAVLEDPDAEVRGIAAGALDEMSWKADSIRSAVAYWIARQDWQQCVQMGHPAVQPLIASLTDGDWRVREAAAQTLGTIGEAQAVEPLCAIMLHDPANYVREAAAEALGRLGEARAIEPLTAALSDSYSHTCSKAADSLDALGWKPGADSVGAAYWVIKRSVHECVAIGAPAIKPLMDQLNEGSLEAAEMAAEALAQIGAPSVEPLLGALQNPYMYARLRAAESLGRIGDARAVNPLIAVLSDACPEVSAAAAQALAGIGTAAVKQLLAGLKSPDQPVRKRAAEDLVSLLKSGKLDPKDRRRILSHRREILELHPF